MKHWPILLALTLLVSALTGCGSNDDGLTKEQRSTGDRVTQIMERSGGDWNALSPEDKKFLVDLANGNEMAAQMQFNARSGRPPAVGPAGAPKGGPGH